MTTAYLVSEPPPLWMGEPPPEPLNESELSWIWAGQRYPDGALALVDGRALRVVSPGRPGGGAGPDFLDAVLEIAGRRVTGDVELHVRSSGFRAHGHDGDRAYDGVALHVVFRADDGASTRLSSGDEAPVAAFAPWFDQRREELQRWLSAEALWREPCCDATARLGEDGVRLALLEAGRRRFEAKVTGMQALSAELGPDEAVWRALLDVMGVGGDREGFRRLAAVFPEAVAREVVAGARDGAIEALGDALRFAGGLGAASGFDASGLPAPLRPALASNGRPANSPASRLAGVAVLYGRASRGLPAFVRESVAVAGSAKALVEAWQVSSAGDARGRALVGPDRARELALNLALPFAATDAGLRPKSESLLARLPAAATYGKTAFLERHLRAGSGRRLVQGAVEQQGLLAYLAEWCSRGGCGRCPLS